MNACGPKLSVTCAESYRVFFLPDHSFLPFSQAFQDGDLYHLTDSQAGCPEGGNGAAAFIDTDADTDPAAQSNDSTHYKGHFHADHSLEGII